MSVQKLFKVTATMSVVSRYDKELDFQEVVTHLASAGSSADAISAFLSSVRTPHLEGELAVNFHDVSAMPALNQQSPSGIRDPSKSKDSAGMNKDGRLGGWIDTASAPRDGTDILGLLDLKDGTYQRMLVWWSEDDLVYPWHYAGGAYVETRIAYWMALPELPEFDFFE